MLPSTGWQHCGCIIPQAVTHNLALLKMGRIICLKHVELIGIVNKPLLLHLVGCLYYLCINVQPSTTTNFICPVSTCYKFRSYWRSSGIKYTNWTDMEGIGCDLILVIIRELSCRNLRKTGNISVMIAGFLTEIRKGGFQISKQNVLNSGNRHSFRLV